MSRLLGLQIMTIHHPIFILVAVGNKNVVFIVGHDIAPRECAAKVKVTCQRLYNFSIKLEICTVTNGEIQQGYFINFAHHLFTKKAFKIRAIRLLE